MKQATGQSQLDAWKLDPDCIYLLDRGDAVRGLLKQLGVPNLFAGSEGDATHAVVAFGNHPTHWIIVHLSREGVGKPDSRPDDRPDKGSRGDELLFEAEPKNSTTREQIKAMLISDVWKNKSRMRFTFRHLPLAGERREKQVS